MNLQQQSQDINFAAVDDMELPANVGVLKQLICQLIVPFYSLYVSDFPNPEKSLSEIFMAFQTSYP